MSFQITVKDEQPKQGLNALQQKTTNLKPILSKIGTRLLEITEASFEDEKAADGKPWVELSPSYLNYKKKSGKTKKLVRKGILIGSIEDLVTQDTLIIGTNIEYAPIHQFGGIAGLNHSAKIPARPFLPIDKDGHMYQNVVSEILGILEKELFK